MQDKKGFIWFATDNGVVRYDGKEMETFQANEGLTDPVVFRFFEDKKGRIWFQTFSGKISYFHNKKIHPYQYNDKVSKQCKGNFLNSLSVDSADNIWLGTCSNISKIDAKGAVEVEDVDQGQLYLKKIEIA